MKATRRDAPRDREATAVCPVCGGANGEVFFTLPGMPVVCNVLWPSKDGGRILQVWRFDVSFSRVFHILFLSAVP